MRQASFTVLAALVLALIASDASAQALAPARLDSGLVQGVRQGDVVAYKGLPFAAPPVGDLRWRPPQPVRPWTGVRPADTAAPGCLQPDPPPGIGRTGPSSEDCLYLNVWRPANAKGPLPVMVWFYGGGFATGSAGWDLFDGAALARHGVMVVTFNYRLGALGFLAHPELTRESGHGASGNYGVMDAIEALQWVRRNARALGGDSGRVTVFGQSAGANIISDLLVSPEAKGLIARAIGESNGSFGPLDSRAPGAIASLAATEKLGADYARSLGAATLADLRRLPPERFLPSPPWAGPIVDGWIVPSAPHDAFAAGRQADVPTLIGSNAQEANFPAPQPPANVKDLTAFFSDNFGPFGPRLLNAYPFATDEEAWRAKVDFFTDFGNRWQIWTWARLQARTGKAPVFVYHFEQPQPLKDQALSRRQGAPHASELFFVFQNERLETFAWTAPDRALADQMARYWTNFARTGDPNGTGLPSWPRFTESSRQVLRLKTSPQAAAFPRGDRIELIDEMISHFK